MCAPQLTHHQGLPTLAMYAAQVRFGAIVIAACAILMGAILGIAPSLGAKPDPIAAYRDPARTVAARAVVVRSDAAGLLVRYLDEGGQEVRAALMGAGALEADRGRAYPVGSSLDVVAMSGRPGAPVMPQALLDTPAPDAPSRLPGLLAMVAGVGGGLAGLRAVRRVTWEQWLRWCPGGDTVGAADLSPSGRRPGVRRAVATRQGRAVIFKLGTGVLMLLALPLLAVGLPPLARTTHGAVASLGWPAVEGTVVESRLRLWRSSGPSNATEQVARVVFTYEVNGRRYAADTPEWTIIGAGWGADAEGVVARYPRGARVPVRYDPAGPHRAVLRPGPLPVSTAVFCGLAALAVLGWLWGVRVLLRPLPPEVDGRIAEIH